MKDLEYEEACRKRAANGDAHMQWILRKYELASITGRLQEAHFWYANLLGGEAGQAADRLSELEQEAKRIWAAHGEER